MVLVAERQALRAAGGDLPRLLRIMNEQPGKGRREEDACSCLKNRKACLPVVDMTLRPRCCPAEPRFLPLPHQGERSYV